MEWKRIFTIISVICIALVAGAIGLWIAKNIIGVLVFLIFAAGGVAGYGIGRLVPRKSKEQREKEAAEKKAKEAEKKE